MNLKTLIISAVVAGAISVGATKSLAEQIPQLLVKLSLSGTVDYTTNSGKGSLSGPIKTVKYDTKSLINLLNASAFASNQVYLVTGKSLIPAGSYFLFDLFGGTLTLTNNNGFHFPLKGSGYDFGSLVINQYQLVGTYSLKSTLAGSETDKTSFYFEFSDGADNETAFKLFGTATLAWTYGAASGGTQKATVKVNMSGLSEAGSFINENYEGVTGSFSASGSGSSANEPTGFVPFFYEY
jgi:hypothetical protein